MAVRISAEDVHEVVAEVVRHDAVLVRAVPERRDAARSWLGLSPPRKISLVTHYLFTRIPFESLRRKISVLSARK